MTSSSNGPTNSAALAFRQMPSRPGDAGLSRSFGAEGIGLDRTEHMFLGGSKQIIQTFILNEDSAVREKAVNELLRSDG